MNTSEKFKAKVMKTGAENYADATVKSNQELDKTLSPLSLKLADEIKALPKFCDREAIAEIIGPHLTNSGQPPK
jgi:hypothetical protein